MDGSTPLLFSKGRLSYCRNNITTRLRAGCEAAMGAGAGVILAVLAVVPTFGGVLTTTPITINNQPTNNYRPRVYGDMAVYSKTIDTLTAYSLEVHYYQFSTNTDFTIPNVLAGGVQASDLSGDVSQGRLVFSRFTGGTVALMMYDTRTSILSELMPPVPGLSYLNPSIGAETVAFIEWNAYTSAAQIIVLNLATSTQTRLTSDGINYGFPSVSPDGKSVTWQKCPTGPTQNCDIYRAVLIQRFFGPTWVTRVVSATPLYEGSPSATDSRIAFERNDQFGPTGSDIVLFQPGLPETVFELPGEQHHPSLSGNYIFFESRIGSGNSDLFFLDIVANQYFQLTQTPTIAESLSAIWAPPETCSPEIQNHVDPACARFSIVWQACPEFYPDNCTILGL